MIGLLLAAQLTIGGQAIKPLSVTTKQENGKLLICIEQSCVPWESSVFGPAPGVDQATMQQKATEVEFTWWPMAAMLGGPVLDRVSTWVALEYGHGRCVESNPRYIGAPFSPLNPNYKAMWRDTARIAAPAILLHSYAWWMSNRSIFRNHAWARSYAAVLRRSAYAVEYMAGGRFAALGVKNTLVCF